MKDWTEDKIIRVGVGWTFLDHDQICRSIPEGKARETAWRLTKAKFKKLDANLVVSDLKKAGIEVLYFHAKSHTGNLWYQSRIGHTFSLLGKRDFFGELVRACRRAGIVPVGMLQITRDSRTAQAHPSWCGTDRKGTGSELLCISNPSWRKYILGLIDEVAANYDIGGICLDELRMSNQCTSGSPCHCRHCRELFKAQSGRAIPRENWEDPLWKQFVEWRYEACSEFLRQARAVVKRGNPDVDLTLVAYVTTKRQYLSGQRIADLGEHLDYINVDIAFSVFEGETAKRFAHFSRKRPEIWTSGSLSLGIAGRGGGCNLCVKPAAEYIPEAMSILASGAAVNMDTYQGTTSTPGRYFDENLMTMISDIAREVRKRKPWVLGDLAPVRYAAVLFSEKSRDHYGTRLGKTMLYGNEFYGLYNAVWQSGLACDVIGEKQLEDGTLGAYRVLLLPNAYALSDEEVAGIRAFVRGGGGLVATYQTSLADGRGNVRGDFGLGDLFGVRYRSGVEDDYDYAISEQIGDRPGVRVVGASHPITRQLAALGGDTMWPSPVLQVGCRGGRAVARVIRRRTGCEAKLSIASLGRGAMEVTGNTAVSVKEVGKGRVVWLNGKAGCLWGLNGHPYVKRLLVDAVKWAGGPPLVEVDAPFCVESIAYRDEKRDRLIVHLVNHQASPTCVADGCTYPTNRRNKDLVPVSDLVVKVDCRALGGKPGKVYLAPGRKPLPFKLGRQWLTVQVDRLKIHGMVVVEAA